MEADPPKEPRILKHQSVGFSVEDEMIVFGGQVVGTLGGEFSGHAQVNAEPAVGSKAEKHLFAVGFN